MNSTVAATSNADRAGLRVFVTAIGRWCRDCGRRHRQRHFLAQLDDRGLRDIGITRADAFAELDKPFWRP